LAKGLTFSIGGASFEADPEKLDRKKLYGYRENIALDDDGAECTLVSTSECGTIVIPKGGTGLGYLSADGNWVDRGEIKTVNLDGSPALIKPSSYSGTITLDQKASPEDLLDCSVAGFYHLFSDPELLTAIGTNIYQFEYCYRDSYETSTAFVLASGNGGSKELFMLIGYKNDFQFLGFDEISVVDEADEEEEDDDGGFDFSF